MAVKVMHTSPKTLSQVKKEGNLDKLIAALEEECRPFNMGNIILQIDSGVRNFVDKATKWANETRNDFYEDAPYLTGNLRESVAIDDSKLPNELFVGVIWEDLRGPKTLQAIRGKWKGKWVNIPAHDYTVEADKNNVSSGGGVGGPFIEELWFAKAERNARRIFR